MLIQLKEDQRPLDRKTEMRVLHLGQDFFHVAEAFNETSGKRIFTRQSKIDIKRDPIN
jgi:hypothetical protein